MRKSRIPVPWRPKADFAVRIAILFLIAHSSSGCSITALRNRTVDIGGSVGSIYTRPVLENLYRLAHDRNAMPSHFSFDTGMIKTTETITPGLNIPLGNQVTRTVEAGGVSQIVGSYNAFTLNGTETVDQSWMIKPQENPTALRRLRILYLFAVGQPGWNDTATALGYTSKDSIDERALAAQIIEHCKTPNQAVGCVRVGGVDDCVSPDAVDRAKAQWICLDHHDGAADRLTGKSDMALSRDAHDRGVLFDLVLFSRMVLAGGVQSDKTKK